MEMVFLQAFSVADQIQQITAMASHPKCSPNVEGSKELVNSDYVVLPLIAY